MFADKEFYKNQYCENRQMTIPQAEFEFWAQQAESCINWRGGEICPVPEFLSRCCCEVAEVLFQNQGRQPGVHSEKAGGFTLVYQKGEQALQDAVRQVVLRHVAGTELHNMFVFGGV